MIDSNTVKDTVRALGADLCGIAPVERFREAPKGFHPTDVYKDCKSVVVFARKVPAGPLFASTYVPYTHANSIMIQVVDRLGITVCLRLEEQGARGFLFHQTILTNIGKLSDFMVGRYSRCVMPVIWQGLACLGEILFS